MDYYHILEVTRNADQATIRKAFHLLSRKYHPDKVSSINKQESEDKFKEINEAYSILSNPEKKEIYDRFGKEGLNRMQQEQHNEDDITSIKVKIEASLEEIYRGVSRSITFSRTETCITCNSTGTKDKQKHPCNFCKGKGHITTRANIGLFIQQHDLQCPKCNLGIDPQVELCPDCNGTLITSEDITVKCDIPAGNLQYVLFSVGHKVAGIGRGKVIINIIPLPHKLFEKTGKLDLKTKIYLSFEESICGFKRTLIHLNGSKLAIISKNIIKDKETKVAVGYGMISNDEYKSKGDLIIEFIVKDRQINLSLKQRENIYFSLVNEFLPKNIILDDEEKLILTKHEEVSSPDEQEQPKECSIQ